MENLVVQVLIRAQIVSVEVEAMKAANQVASCYGHTPPYSEQDFLDKSTELQNLVSELNS